MTVYSVLKAVTKAYADPMAPLADVKLPISPTGPCHPSCWQVVRDHRVRPSLDEAARRARQPGKPARWTCVGQGRLPHRREGRRDEQLVFLADRADAGLRRPCAAGAAGFLAHAGALVKILVHPDVGEFVECAELARPARRQR